MSSTWIAGKILWFDEIAGEGYVVDETGNSFYVHFSNIFKKRSQQAKKNRQQIPNLKKDQKVKFKIYSNSYLTQVQELVA